MYAKINTGVVENYPYTIDELRKNNPQTSFPTAPTEELLSEWGVFSVRSVAQPSYDILTQMLTEGAPQQIDGGWHQVWLVENLPQSQAEANVRNRRDALISSCDWTQLTDVQVDKEAWAVYRQALRNVPQQTGFPFTVQWPVPPA